MPAPSINPACATWENSTSGWPTPEWERVEVIKSTSTPPQVLFPNMAAWPCLRLQAWGNSCLPRNMWSEKNRTLPQWFNLPISVPAYAYLASFEYAGLFGVLSYTHQFVDRDIRTAQELVDDSQLYPAFIMKYATEAYRRKMHDPSTASDSGPMPKSPRGSSGELSITTAFPRWLTTS